MSRFAIWPQLSQTSAACDLADDVILDVKHVSKKFCRNLQQSLRYGARDMVTELFTGRRPVATRRPGEFWAAHNITLQLRRGEALGLVGRNGAGKSTLLRMIAGVIRPDTGTIRIRGRVAPLLSLGAGLKAILTGRENIFCNMAMLGLTFDQIKKRFDSVVDFAELHAAIDAPVQTYSKGMKARLGFSCAIHVDPDVFIIDEALAVGDLSFRVKCYRKLAELRNRGVSLLLVSHNPHIITAVCDKAAYLRDGNLAMSGDAEEVVVQYKRDLEATPAAAKEPAANAEPAGGVVAYSRPGRTPEKSPGADILAVEFGPDGGASKTTLCSGEPALLKVLFQCHRTVRNANVWVAVKKRGGDDQLYLAFNSRNDESRKTFAPGRHEIQLRLPYCGLAEGSYMMKLYIEEPRLAVLDVADWSDLNFRVSAPNSMLNCAYYQPREWTFQAVEEQMLSERAAA